MGCPFPGMDPYIERPEIWADFHDSLIACIRGIVQPLLRPRYVALTQDRLYVVESGRPIYPDVSVLRTPSSAHTLAKAVTLEVDAPVVFDLQPEEIRQPLIHIVEPAAGNRVVTAIEVLSPDNKTASAGRAAYLQKREELRGSGANLVEIDLLREGEPTVRISPENLAGLRPWHYLVTVTRSKPPRQEIYPVLLQKRLPRFALPLADDDKDVPLDLQAAFTRCWNEGPYPELLRYEGLSPGRMTAEEVTWCEDVLRRGGFRSDASIQSGAQ